LPLTNLEVHVMSNIPCSCEAVEDALGQTVCRRCRGDWYGCECEPPVRHRDDCDFRTPTYEDVLAENIEASIACSACSWPGGWHMTTCPDHATEATR
jgi:hypothetical protein